jgi:TRAP-type uncharacterized transport system fused permease subunit
MPSVKEALKKGWYYILPVIVFLYFVSIKRYTAQASIFYAVVLLFVIGLLRKEGRLNLKRLLIAFQIAMKVGTTIAPLFMAVGVVLACADITGLGIRFSTILVDTAGGNMSILLILTFITSFIMGTGMPVYACYFIIAILIAPALTDLGVLPIAAHLFVICAAQVHHFTPPNMPMAAIAAGIANSNIWKTAWQAMRLAVVFVIIPFVFIYNPALLLQGGHSIGETATLVVFCLFGVVALSAGIQGWLVKKTGWVQRVILLVSGFLAIANINAAVSITGIGLLFVNLIWQHFEKKQVVASEREALVSLQ